MVLVSKTATGLLCVHTAQSILHLHSHTLTEILLTKVGGPQISWQIANSQTGGLTKFDRFADLPPPGTAIFRFAKLRFADPIFFSICKFAICGFNQFFIGDFRVHPPRILPLYSALVS
jgi:hypothetical protein